MKTIRNIFSVTILMAVALTFAGCQGEEPDLFEKSAAERLNEVADDYAKILAESEAGWIMEYYPTNSNEDPTGLGYLMLVDFDNNGSVKIGMLNDMTEGAYEESTSLWEIITDNGPVLSFSTYNEILHYFSDPALYDQGLGLEGDYEFVMVDVPEDHQTIMLKGKKRSTYVRLTRLPAGTDFEAYLADVRAFQKKIFSDKAPNYDYMQLGEKEYEMADMSTTLPNMYLYGTDAIANEYHIPFIVTKIDGAYHLRFRTAPFDLGIEDEANPQEFVYNEGQDKFVSVDNESYVIEGDVPARFFKQNLDGSGTVIWKFDRNTNKSEAMQAIFDKAYDNFQTIAYTFENAAIMKASETNNLRLTCSYMKKQGNRYIKQTTNYLYEMATTRDGDNIAFSFVGCNEAAQTLLTTFPDVKAFVDAIIGQTFKVDAANSRFNLNGVKLTNASDGNIWFDISL